MAASRHEGKVGAMGKGGKSFIFRTTQNSETPKIKLKAGKFHSLPCGRGRTAKKNMGEGRISGDKTTIWWRAPCFSMEKN